MAEELTVSPAGRDRLGLSDAAANDAHKAQKAKVDSKGWHRRTVFGVCMCVGVEEIVEGVADNCKSGRSGKLCISKKVRNTEQ